MAKELTTIPFEEFNKNPNGVLERVLRKREAVIVETESGERAVIKPARPKTGRGQHVSEADLEAFRSSAGGWPDIDMDSFLARTYESRQLRSRPPVKL